MHYSFVSCMILGPIKMTISINYYILYAVPKSQLRRGDLKELVLAGRLAPPYPWDKTSNQVPPGYKVVLQGTHVCMAHLTYVPSMSKDTQVP